MISLQIDSRTYKLAMGVSHISQWTCSSVNTFQGWKHLKEALEDERTPVEVDEEKPEVAES